MADKAPTQLTTEQVDAMFATATVTFNSYYKYVFYFSGETVVEGETYHLSCSEGGSSDDIYRGGA